MKNALISPNEQVSYISAWTSSKPPQPVYELIPDSARVAQISTEIFPIAEPLFWIECSDEAVADVWYYNTSTGELLLVPAPEPAPSNTSTTTITPASGDIPTQIL